MTIGDEITLIDTLLNERGDPADLHERSHTSRARASEAKS
jgi:hypothetical protein